MLDILISLCLVFALFSGLVSGINELFVQVLEMRGQVLYQAVALLLGEATKTDSWKRFIFLQPLQDEKGKNTPYPTPRTSELFAHPLIDTLSQPGSKPSYIAPSTFAAALVQVLSPNDNSWTTLGAALSDRSEPLGKLFGPMFDQANGDIDKFKSQVESHFNLVMDRVSGWYRRRSQAVMFVIALVLAVVLNVDTIYIARHLQKHPQLVTKMVETAKKLNDTTINSLDEKVKKLDEKVGSKSEALTKADIESFKLAVSDLKDKTSEFQNLNLPIGWDHFEIKDISPSTVMGWFITALAATLGSPFWFDAISKLFAIRGTGRKPENLSAISGTPVTPAVQVTLSPASSLLSEKEDIPLNEYEASHLNEEDIAGLQKALGLSAMQVNGRFSVELRTALRKWQRETGHIVSGQLDEPTVLAILYPEA